MPSSLRDAVNGYPNINWIMYMFRNFFREMYIVDPPIFIYLSFIVDK